MTKPKPKLTRETLHLALQPPNNCRVKAFRDTLSPEEQELLDEALGYDKRDLGSGALRQWVIEQGFDPELVPGTTAINDHRSGRRPCRCQG